MLAPTKPSNSAVSAVPLARTVCLIFGILLPTLATWLRFDGLERQPMVQFDSVAYTLSGRNWAEHGYFTLVGGKHLFALIIGLIYKAGLPHEQFPSHWLSAASGFVMVLLICLLTRRVWSGLASIYATGLAATSLLLIWWSRMGNAYTLSASAVLLLLLFLADPRLLTAPLSPRRAIVAGFLAGLAFVLHTSALLLLPALIVWLVLRRVHKGLRIRTHLKQLVTGLILICLGFAVPCLAVDSIVRSSRFCPGCYDGEVSVAAVFSYTSGESLSSNDRWYPWLLWLSNADACRNQAWLRETAANWISVTPAGETKKPRPLRLNLAGLTQPTRLLLWTEGPWFVLLAFLSVVYSAFLWRARGDPVALLLLIFAVVPFLAYSLNAGLNGIAPARIWSPILPLLMVMMGKLLGDVTSSLVDRFPVRLPVFTPLVLLVVLLAMSAHGYFNTQSLRSARTGYAEAGQFLKQFGPAPIGWHGRKPWGVFLAGSSYQPIRNAEDVADFLALPGRKILAWESGSLQEVAPLNPTLCKQSENSYLGVPVFALESAYRDPPTGSPSDPPSSSKLIVCLFE